MNHIQTEFANLITSLSEENFNHLIKEFNKEYYQSSDVRIVNGPYDGGIDLEVYKNGELIKRNIQITVQKTKLEAKLYSDLAKAKENSAKFGYQKNLDFYCTIGITGDTKRSWKRTAIVDYGIDLKLYDSHSLSALGEEFHSIKKSLFEIFGVEKHSELINVDKHTKVLYDMFAIGKDAGELKKQFLHSLIITYIFEHPNCTELELDESLKKPLNNNKQIHLIIKSHVDSLRGKGIIISGSEKFQLQLAPEKREEIQELLNTSLAQEGLLKMELEHCLSKYHLQNETKRIVDFIYKTFQIHYDADLEELSGSSNHQGVSIKKIYRDLEKFLQNKIRYSESTSKATREILDICTCNEYLKKISASILFTKLFQSNKLDIYLKQQKQFLFLDTQILLRLICLDVNKNNIPDITVKSVADFVETVNKYKSTIFLKTSHEYVSELTKQIYDALRLDRFFRLPIMQNLSATTNNVIYNYYQTLVNNKLYDSQLTIFDFVSDILDLKSLPKTNSQQFNIIVSNRIERIFSFLDIEIVSIPFKEEFIGIRKEYESSLQEKVKSNKAIDNDIKTIGYLSDSSINIDEETKMINEPFLISWDKSFFNARKKILSKYPNRTYWYIYTPARFADRVSLQNFQLNPTAINNNIVSLTESNFNVSSSTSFVDLMSSIFDSEDIANVKIAHRLIQLEDMTKPKNEEPNHEIVQEETPVIRVLGELRRHYFKQENRFNFEDLVVTLENNLFEDDIYEIIESNVQYLKSHKQLKIDLFSKFDSLIEREKIQSDEIKAGKSAF